ncbi:MAG: radical SAM family heme chaperone HemW [Candidatus Omnitrophota bacterium]
MANSLYMHIPFCRGKCPYCDFISVSYDKGLAGAYLEVLYRQIAELEGEFSTIYIGGGTPTILDKAPLEKLLKLLKKLKTKEFTVEANPESLTADKLKLFLDCGVNRISIGIQSLYDYKLKQLGRIHSSKQAREAVFLAKKIGFKNVSIDLIFGLWGESLESWQRELEEAGDLPITHISVYSLTYEKGTSFYERMKKKEITPLNGGIMAKMYKFAINYLPKKGFEHYEVSNFAHKGFFCRHNLNYWQNCSYIGLGASAVSYQKGVRSRITPDIKDYILKLNKEEQPVVFKEKLSPLKRAKETAALKIRTKQGIDFDWFKGASGFDFMEIESGSLEELAKKGLFKYRKKAGEAVGVYLTKKGFLFCDEVCAGFL